MSGTNKTNDWNTSYELSRGPAEELNNDPTKDAKLVPAQI